MKPITDLDLLQIESAIKNRFMIQVGSLVESKIDWTACKVQYGYRYPDKKEFAYLEVKEIRYIPGISFPILIFWEGPFGNPQAPYGGGLCSSAFREVQEPVNVKKFISEICER